MKRYSKVAVGGTFDELHRGHKALICRAFEVGEKVVVGLSSDAFVARMGKPHITSSFEERYTELERFLNSQGFAGKFEIIPLNDALGRTMAATNGLTALVVSKETEKTAKTINEKRLRVGMKPLKIVTVAMVPAENNSPISTTRIRSGEIDRNGHLLKAIQK